jgi:hypothetical protein
METNTVVLNLWDYNELREFKEKMEEGYTYKLNQPYKLYQPYSAHYNPIVCPTNLQPAKYITTDLALKELLERNDKLTAINNELYEECIDLKNNRPPNINISELKKMSIWEFIKWRKTK